MDNLVSWIMGASPEETVVRFFIFAMILHGIFDMISAVIGGTRH